MRSVVCRRRHGDAPEGGRGARGPGAGARPRRAGDAGVGGAAAARPPAAAPASRARAAARRRR